MKALKQIVALALSLSMLFSFAAAAGIPYEDDFDVSESFSGYPQTVSVIEQGNGTYLRVDNTAVPASDTDLENDILTLSLVSEAGIYTDNALQDDSAEANYFLCVNEDSFLLVNEVTIDLLNTQEMEEIFVEYDVAPEIQDDLRIAAQKALEQGQSESIVVFYTPKSSRSTRAGTSNSYTYKGAQMRDDVAIYKNQQASGTVTSGSKVIDTAKETVSGKVGETIINVLEGSSTIVKEVIPFFKKSLTIFNAFLTYYEDTTFTAKSGNYLNFSTIYDKYMKYTYANHNDGNGYRLGARTMYVIFEDTEIKLNLWKQDKATTYGSGEYVTANMPATEFQGSIHTDHYTGPAAYAYGASVGGNVYEETLWWKVANKTFVA